MNLKKKDKQEEEVEEAKGESNWVWSTDCKKKYNQTFSINNFRHC